ncbi:hypothetical protein MASR2M36_08380 [Providencia sp.]
MSKDVIFKAGDAKPANSSLSINKSRIIANNGQNEGVATVTLIARDGQNNPVDGLKDDLQFVVLKGDIVVTNGVFIKNVSATATPGQYIADVSGIDVGNYVIKVKIGGEYLGELNAGITLYSYNFYINENVINRDLIPEQIVKFIVNATPTDNSTIKLTVNNVIWSSSNGNAGVLSGDTFTAKNAGKTIITGSNIKLNGIIGNNLNTTLTVLTPNNSILVGSQSGKKINDLISPPDYKLYTQVGDIIDGIGSNLTGGGTKVEITKLNNITKIDTWRCDDGKYGGLISRIVFYAADGSTQITGDNICRNGSSPKKFNAILFPKNSAIVGVNTWQGTSITGFKGVTTTQWLYHVRTSD